jgi:hypothetical protein
MLLPTRNPIVPKELITLIALIGLERGASASEHGKNRRSPNWHGTAKRGYLGFRI